MEISTAEAEVAHDELSQKVRQYSVGEEIANATTHGVGALLGVAALVILIVRAWPHGGLALLAAIVYGTSIILEFSASTLYHALTNLKAKKIFKILDHASIYLLIAGTYTPFCLVTLRDAGGPTLAAIVWAIALIGIAAEGFWVFRPRWVSALLYLAMGWLVVFKVGDLIPLIHPTGLILLVVGGVAYTLGTIFYVLKKVPYMHSVWHLWVLAGAIAHFLAVVLYVI